MILFHQFNTLRVEYLRRPLHNCSAATPLSPLGRVEKLFQATPGNEPGVFFIYAHIVL